MILQVGGSISFAPEGDGADASGSATTLGTCWPSSTKPDQVTIAINTNQMNIVELMTDDDIAGTSFERAEVYEAYREMYVPAGPELGRGAPQAPPATDPAALPARQHPPARDRGAADPPGHYMGPLNLTWVAIGGGFDGPNPYNMMNFINRVPDGACLTLETLMRSVLPVNTMAIAMGLHPRAATRTPSGPARPEDHLGAAGRAARPHRQRARSRGRHRQGGARHLPHRRDLRQRRRDLARLGYAPNRKPGQLGFTFHA